MKFNKPINRETEINNETFVVTMDEIGVSFRVKGKRKSLRADWPAILFIARAEATDAGRPGSSNADQEEETPDTIGRGATAGDITPLS
jgi:hypothetical protein